MPAAPKRPPSEHAAPTPADGASITGGRSASEASNVERPAGSGNDGALETFEQNAEHGTSDARLRQDTSDAPPDSRTAGPD